MDITAGEVSGCPVLRISGPLGIADGPRLRDALAKAVSSWPECVVCDLGAVSALDPSCVAVFAAAQWSSPWPGPVIWLTGATGMVARTVQAMRAERFLAFAATVDDALAFKSSRPPMLRERLTLAPTLRAPRQARAFVVETLQRWGLETVLDDAVLIVNELVSDAVLQAHGDLQVVLQHGHGLVRIAVRERRSGVASAMWAPPVERTNQPTTSGGLNLVRQLATGFGQDLAPDGQKVMWATLRIGPMRRGVGDAAVATPETLAHPGAVTETIVVNAARVHRSPGAGWTVRLTLRWEPADPDHVTISLSSTPAHPALPRGRWRVERSLLERGISGPATSGRVNLKPEANCRAASFELRLGRSVHKARVPIVRLTRFLERTSP